jgi:Domain of Unknown Function with PDB structure (DUF3857)
LWWGLLAAAAAWAQEPAAKPAEPAPAKKEAAKAEEKTAPPFQIALLETHVRFEANGDSRKDVHTIVKINDLAGARQFSRVGFEYDRAFQTVEIPLVKISHANGGTSEILPSAITDVVNPAVEKFPAYQDLRVKAVRILGLQEGDTLEYRVITTTIKPPLAPDFWLEHTFDRSGQVQSEIYELELPATRVQKADGAQRPNEPPIAEIHAVQDPGYKSKALSLNFSKNIPQPVIESRGESRVGYTVFQWKAVNLPPETGQKLTQSGDVLSSDVELSTFATWGNFSAALFEDWMKPRGTEAPGISQKSQELIGATSAATEKLRKLYEFVATQILTVDIPLGATWFAIRAPGDTLNSKYGTPIDKAILLVALAHAAHIELSAALAPTGTEKTGSVIDWPVIPSRLDHAFACDCELTPSIFLDPGLEVAPFGVVPAELRGKVALVILPRSASPKITGVRSSFTSESWWRSVPNSMPFPAEQKVFVEAAMTHEGNLSAHVKYVLRGDNELLLREAFHQSPKERWNEVGGMLALADGFRGHIDSVKASDPMETIEPFTVEYEIAQPKFVDWTKKPVRIPALLPQIALPDTAGKAAGRIELGTPLDVETHLRLQLPKGTTVQTPPGTSVEQDYATYVSKYDGQLNTLAASRHIHFLLREIPQDRAADYNAFVRAVQLDQAQVITLFPAAETPKEKSSPQR